MRQYNRRFVHRGTRVETVLALLPNPLTRVELPNAPPPPSVQNPPSGDQRHQPPTSGNGPPGHR